MNFTRTENIKKLTCRSRNTIGQSEASVNVDILCKNFFEKKTNKLNNSFHRSTKIIYG